jgi:DNA repair ATPase RecN
MTKEGTLLLENLNKAVTGAQIQKISEDLRALVTDFQDALKAADVGQLSEDMRRLIGGLEKSNSELRAILKNLEPMARSVGPEIKVLLQNLAVASANLAQFSAEVKRRPSLLLWGSPPQPKPSPAQRRR